MTGENYFGAFEEIEFSNDSNAQEPAGGPSILDSSQGFCYQHRIGWYCRKEHVLPKIQAVPGACQEGVITAMAIRLLRRAGRFLSCEKAVSALEYAVLAGVVIAGVGAAIVAFTGDLTTAIKSLGTNIEKTANTGGKTNLTPTP